MTEDKPVPFRTNPNTASTTSTAHLTFTPVELGSPESPSEGTEPPTPTEGPGSPESASNPPPKRRGRPPKPKAKTEAEIRAEITAEVTAQVLAEMKSQRVSESTLKTSEIAEAQPDDEDGVLINFVADGLTLLGTTWCRGEELSVKRGSEEWKQTLDSRGRSILEYSEREQLARWGRRIYSQGHWLGTGYDLNDPNLTKDEREALVAAEERRAIRSAQPGSRKARGRLNN